MCFYFFGDHWNCVRISFVPLQILVVHLKPFAKWSHMISISCIWIYFPKFWLCNHLVTSIWKCAWNENLLVKCNVLHVVYCHFFFIAMCNKLFLSIFQILVVPQVPFWVMHKCQVIFCHTTQQKLVMVEMVFYFPCASMIYIQRYLCIESEKILSTINHHHKLLGLLVKECLAVTCITEEILCL